LPPPELRQEIDRRAPKPPTQPPPIPYQHPPFGHEDEPPTVAMVRRPSVNLNEFGRARPPTPPPAYPMQPPMQHGQQRPPSTPPFGNHQFDMDRMAARDAAMSRMIWIVVIVIAVAIVVAVASQL
jgi:hypothetical protein